MLQKRVSAARLIGCSPDEVALIGPTSLGLSLFANGLDWQQAMKLSVTWMTIQRMFTLG